MEAKDIWIQGQKINPSEIWIQKPSSNEEVKAEKVWIQGK